MTLVWLVGLGGAIGSMARYLLTGIAQRAGSMFPLGTLVVNVAGCLLLGLVLGQALLRPAAVTPAWRAFLAIGVCGGFTTFSAFSYDTLELMRVHQNGLAIASVAANLVLGLLAVWAGLAISRGV